MVSVPNADCEAGWSYHNATKHSRRSIHAHPHFLDWANQPLPFKVYSTLELLPLPREVRQTSVPALSAIAEMPQPNHAIPDLHDLSQLLYFSAGITRPRTYPGGEIYFRAAACTGALYEIELYLACGPSAISKRAFITSLPASSGCTSCVLATIAVCWSERPPPSLQSCTRRLSSSAPEPIGGMLGNTRHAPTAILAGTTARYWPTCWL